MIQVGKAVETQLNSVTANIIATFDSLKAKLNERQKALISEVYPPLSNSLSLSLSNYVPQI